MQEAASLKIHCGGVSSPTSQVELAQAYPAVCCPHEGQSALVCAFCIPPIPLWTWCTCLPLEKEPFQSLSVLGMREAIGQAPSSSTFPEAATAGGQGSVQPLGAALIAVQAVYAGDNS